MARGPVQPDPVDLFPDRYLDLPEVVGLMTVSTFLQALNDGTIQPRQYTPKQKRLSDEFRFAELREQVE